MGGNLNDSPFKDSVIGVTKLDDTPASYIKYDLILEKMGGFGKYQCLMTVLMVVGYVNIGTILYSLPFAELLP